MDRGGVGDAARRGKADEADGESADSCDDTGMLITSPCVVSLSWTLKDAEGDLIDELAEPMEFMVGGDDLFAKIEEALQGLGAGQEVDLHLEPEHAFGDYHAELVCFEKRELFPEQLEPGMQFEGPPSGAATPDMPADSMGGQVNLITKSAFEQARPSYSGRVFFNVNSLQTSIKKTPGPITPTYKIQPAFEVGVIYPVTKNLGVSFDATSTNEINQSYVSSPTWTTTGTISNLAGNPISLSNPALTRAQATDISRLAKRISTNLGIDWKPTRSGDCMTSWTASFTGMPMRSHTSCCRKRSRMRTAASNANSWRSRSSAAVSSW